MDYLANDRLTEHPIACCFSSKSDIIRVLHQDNCCEYSMEAKTTKSGQALSRQEIRDSVEQNRLPNCVKDLLKKAYCTDEETEKHLPANGIRIDAIKQNSGVVVYAYTNNACNRVVFSCAPKRNGVRVMIVETDARGNRTILRFDPTRKKSHQYRLKKIPAATEMDSYEGCCYAVYFNDTSLVDETGGRGLY